MRSYLGKDKNHFILVFFRINVKYNSCIFGLKYMQPNLIDNTNKNLKSDEQSHILNLG